MQKARLAIMASGKGSNMAALIYAAQNPKCPYDIALVASNKPDCRAIMLAKAEGIATFALSHKGMSRTEHDMAMHSALQDARTDYVALAGYMRVLSDAFVKQWDGRMLNIHPSLLPRYKGLNTHQRALDAGDGYAGCSIHLVTAELDDGPVLAQRSVKILPDDNAESLAERVQWAEHQLYPETVSAYINRIHDPAWLHDKVNTLALALPQTHARESHGSPGWRVGTEKSGKFFAHFIVRHHGSNAIGVLVKTSGMDELENLCQEQPETYWKPAYYGASGWIGIRLNQPNIDWNHVNEWLHRSWRSVAPKSLTRLLDAADNF